VLAGTDTGLCLPKGFDFSVVETSNPHIGGSAS
jgi:hypothetical protein